MKPEIPGRKMSVRVLRVHARPIVSHGYHPGSQVDSQHRLVAFAKAKARESSWIYSVPKVTGKGQAQASPSEFKAQVHITLLGA